MAHWTARPDPSKHTTNIQMLRTPPGPGIGGLVLAPDAIGAYTHYWRGRTTICEHPLCEPCDAHHAPRWYGYLAIASRATKTLALLEITPTCLPPIDAWLAEYGTLRGADITLRRANKKPNSRLTAEIKASNYDPSKLAACPNVVAHLERIWEIKLIPVTGAANSTDLHGQRIIELPRTFAGENGREC